MTIDLVSDNREFRRHVIKRLGAIDLDFIEQMTFIRKRQEEGKQWSASGVLVPLEFDPVQKEYVIILNKRSSFVQQPGDLCCPGGGMGHRLDRILVYFLARNIVPPVLSGPFQRVPRLSDPEREIFMQVFASVLRESWEEMHLNPCNVEYLGALPSQPMQNFPKIIFPVVGRIRHAWKAKLNWEVDRIIRVPIRWFFEFENYAIFSQTVPSPLREKAKMDRWELPCLVVREEGSEEILWGATFKILLNFVHTVMDLPIEKIHPQQRIERDLPRDYFTGQKRR